MTLSDELRAKCAFYADRFPESLPNGWTSETCGCERHRAARRIEYLEERRGLPTTDEVPMGQHEADGFFR